MLTPTATATGSLRRIEAQARPARVRSTSITTVEKPSATTPMT